MCGVVARDVQSTTGHNLNIIQWETGPGPIDMQPGETESSSQHEIASCARWRFMENAVSAEAT